jgi:hypothetical protein
MSTDELRLRGTQYLCLSVLICGSNKNLLIPSGLQRGGSFFEFQKELERAIWQS